MRELMMPRVPESNIQYESPYNQQLLVMKDTAFVHVKYVTKLILYNFTSNSA